MTLGLGGRHEGLEGVWKGGRVGEGKGSPAAWGRNFSNRCRFGGPRSARWCNLPASEPVSWGDPDLAASSQPGGGERESPQTLKCPSRRARFWNAHSRRRTRSLVSWYDERAGRRSRIPGLQSACPQDRSRHWIANPAAGVLPGDTQVTAYIILSRLVQDGITNMV